LVGAGLVKKEDTKRKWKYYSLTLKGKMIVRPVEVKIMFAFVVTLLASFGLAYNFIKKQIKEGRQVFVICPLIDISDKLGVKSVKEEFTKLDKNIFPDLKIGILHGRMKAKDKEKTMQEFFR